MVKYISQKVQTNYFGKKFKTLCDFYDYGCYIIVTKQKAI